MEHQEQLAWEARAGRPAAVFAFLAALLGIASGIYLQAAIGGASDADEYLREAERQPTEFIVSGILIAVGSVLIVPAIAYLFRAARHRRPQLTPAALYLIVLGAITVAVVAVLRYIEITNIAEDFFPFNGRDAEEAAEDELRDSVSPVLQGLGIGGTLAQAFGVIMVSLNAMRAGLLSRFMGILGIFVGVVLVIPLGVQILQLFWFAALGVLFLNRWPGGRGPAWETGEAIPWPGAAQQREELERRRAESEQGEAPAPEPEPEAAPGEQRPTSRKRRKKQDS